MKLLAFQWIALLYNLRIYMLLCISIIFDLNINQL